MPGDGQSLRLRHPDEYCPGGAVLEGDVDSADDVEADSAFDVDVADAVAEDSARAASASVATPSASLLASSAAGVPFSCITLTPMSHERSPKTYALNRRLACGPL